MNKKTFKIEGMTCSACSNRVERVTKKLPGVQSSVVNFATEKLTININEDEIGYIALHIHSSLGNEKISQAMEMAMLVRDCITSIEQSIGKTINIESLSYNRLMSHIKYMTARTLKGETLKLDMNDYIKERFEKSFEIAEDICRKLGSELNKEIKDVEIGYLAIHIERVFSDELENRK